MHEEERIIGVRCAQRLAEEAIFRLEAALRPDMTGKAGFSLFSKNLHGDTRRGEGADGYGHLGPEQRGVS